MARSPRTSLARHTIAAPAYHMVGTLGGYPAEFEFGAAATSARSERLAAMDRGGADRRYGGT